MKKKLSLVLVALAAAMVILTVICLCLGRYGISVTNVVKILLSPIFKFEKTWDSTMEAIVFNIRLPRALLALLVGASLSMSGTVYQGIFKNPLVSPDLLGVSAGACVGASIAILMDLASLGIQLFALCGGLLAVLLTTALPRLFKNDSTLMLVLSGVIIGGFMNAVIGLIKFLVDTDTKLAEMTYWMMGSIAGATMRDVRGIVIPCAVCAAVLLCLSWRVNILSLGDSQAKSLGVNVRKIRGIIILCSTFITASVVSVSGTIGWVGLVIPHFSRMLVGPDNKRCLPVSIFLGGCFMLAIDTIARSLTPAELPLSIVTSFVGAPIYAVMLYMQGVKLR